MGLKGLGLGLQLAGGGLLSLALATGDEEYPDDEIEANVDDAKLLLKFIDGIQFSNIQMSYLEVFDCLEGAVFGGVFEAVVGLSPRLASARDNDSRLKLRRPLRLLGNGGSPSIIKCSSQPFLQPEKDKVSGAKLSGDFLKGFS